MAKHKEIDFQKWEQLESYGEKMKAAVWAASQAVKRWLDLADELMDDAAADGSNMYCAACVVNENLQKMLEYPSVIGFRVIVDASVVNSLGEVEKVIRDIEPNGFMKITDEGRKSSKGNYVSYTVPVKVSCEENLRKIYEAVGALSCVKHII